MPPAPDRSSRLFDPGTAPLPSSRSPPSSHSSYPRLLGPHAFSNSNDSHFPFHLIGSSLPPLLAPGDSVHSPQPAPSLPPLRLLSGLVDGRGSGQHSESPTALPASTAYTTATAPPHRPTISSLLYTLNEIGQSLDDANAHLRTLLDSSIEPTPAPAASGLMSLSTLATSHLAGGRREPSRSDDGSRLAKRRRLDGDPAAAASTCAGFRYGRYGEVKPGRLTMEIVSCDGGLYSDGGYAAENILKRDTSVYCTKGDRCNIVLQHQGCTTFSLKELIIKAPGRNYSSPVREGLVYFSMTKDELLSANQYHADAAAAAAAAEATMAAHSAISGPTTSSSRTLNNMRLYRNTRLTTERLTGGLGADGDPDNAMAEGLFGIPLEDYEHNDPSQRPRRMATGSATGTGVGTSTSDLPHFPVLAECSDDESDDAAAATTTRRSTVRSRPALRSYFGEHQEAARMLPSSMRRHAHRLGLPVSDDLSFDSRVADWSLQDSAAGAVDMYATDDDYYSVEDTGNQSIMGDEDDYLVFGNDGRNPDGAVDSAYMTYMASPAAVPAAGVGSRDSRSRRSRRNRNGDENDDENDENDENDEEDDEDEGEDDNSAGPATFVTGSETTGTDNGDGSGSMRTATFRIADDRTCCKIRFDPPVAARYILLKIWNPRQDIAGNIDIQGVVAKGYAGPRYFPSRELR